MGALKHLISVVLIGFTTILFSQNYEGGILPEVLLSKSLSPTLKLVNSIEFRQFYYEDNALSYHYALTDIETSFSKKTNDHQNIALGYMLRVRSSGRSAHRLGQQWSIVHRSTQWKIGQRFKADQTFESSEEAEFRFRYRLAGEKALSGLYVDQREYYIKVSSEALMSFTKSQFDPELRIAFAVGYEISKNVKIEIGLDQRFNEFYEEDFRYRTFIGMNAYTIW